MKSLELEVNNNKITVEMDENKPICDPRLQILVIGSGCKVNHPEGNHKDCKPTQFDVCVSDKADIIRIAMFRDFDESKAFADRLIKFLDDNLPSQLMINGNYFLTGSYQLPIKATTVGSDLYEFIQVIALIEV